MTLRSGAAQRRATANQPAAAEQMPGRDALPGLLPDLAAIVVCTLNRRSLRAFAATSTVSLRLVLESRADLAEFRVAEGLERAISRLGDGDAARQRSNISANCRLATLSRPRWFHVRVPLHAAAAICTHLRSCRAARIMRVLPAAILPLITRLRHAESSRQLVLSVPACMTGLQAVAFVGCKLQNPVWLPHTSLASLRTLSLASMALVCLPGGLTALETLNVNCCHTLAADWFHADSAGSVRTLSMRFATRCVPGGLSALEHLDIAFYSQDADWLPPSSTAQLKTLAVTYPLLVRLPLTLSPTLQEVSVNRCTSLAADWMPAACAGSVRVLNVSATALTRIPELPALEELHMHQCTQLDVDWLPPVSAALLRVLDMTNCTRSYPYPPSRPLRVPGNLARLQTLRMAHCHNVAPDWLPQSSRASITSLDVSGTRLTHLPGGLPALETLNVNFCRSLSRDDWLPAESAARVRSLSAEDSNMQNVPPGMQSLQDLRIRGSACGIQNGVPQGALASLAAVDGMDLADFARLHA